MNSGFRWLLAILVVAIAFGVGYGWQYLRASDLQEQLTAVQAELRLERLNVDLGLAAFEAQQGNYEVARRQASAFFSSLQEAVDSMSVPQRAHLASILDRRDRAITTLSRAHPESAAILSGLFARIRSGASAAPEPAAGAPAAPPGKGAESTTAP